MIHRRMSVLFLVALVLLMGQAARIRPLAPPAFVRVWQRSEQLLPVAVPAWPSPELPAEPGAQLAFLGDRSVDWEETSGLTGCSLFVRISLHHWARVRIDQDRWADLLGPRAVDLEHGGRTALLHLAREDLLDDDNADGNSLDTGELRMSGGGIEVRLLCVDRAEGRGEG